MHQCNYCSLDTGGNHHPTCPTLTNYDPPPMRLVLFDGISEVEMTADDEIRLPSWRVIKVAEIMNAILMGGLRRAGK